MGEKDLAEKYLESYNDVFADILNVLLFDGKEIINPSELSESITETQYKADGKAHEQRRDIAKFWEHDRAEIVLIGLENQTRADKDMVFRVIGYDGAYYKAQLKEKKKVRYPIVTIVLYFGMRRWKKAKSIHERVILPKELEPYISDYRINVFEIEYNEQEGEEITMCEVLDRIEERGVKKGICLGEERNNALNQCLIKTGRMEDLIRATTDDVYREQLYKEFGL